MANEKKHEFAWCFFLWNHISFHNKVFNLSDQIKSMDS